MNDRMAFRYRVMFVTGAGFWPHWCGVSESLYQIVQYMQEPVLVVTSGVNGITQRLAKEGIPVVVNPFPVTLFGNFRSRSLRDKAQFTSLSLGYGRRLLRLLRHYGTQVVYVSDGIPMMLGTLPVKLSGAQLVLGVRGEPGQGLHWRLAFQMSDQIVSLSYEMRERILELGLKHFQRKLLSKTSVIYNGVDLDSVRARSHGSESIRSALGLDNQSILILYVGAFEPRKAQLEFIEQTLPRFFERQFSEQEVHFAFVGTAKSDQDKSYETTCQQVAQDASFRHLVHFVGFQENVWPWYAAADIVVLASHSEGMPRTVIEAMTSSKPVISYAVTSTRELLQDTDAGIVISQGDVVGLTDAIVRLSQDADLRSMMGKKGRAFAEAKLDIRAVAQSYDRLFWNLMSV